ncbi:MAG TPA: chemotaxis protein CheW [Vicinamibacterales bacterium]|nr:chemotaxis protein CheW [Vicinamibacterales bacterium]
MTRSSNAGEDILCCDVGSQRFAFRSRDVRHVERAEYLHPDRQEDGCVGTLKLGGQQVPVYSIAQLLGTTSANAHAIRDAHIAITADRNRMTGWLVDRIERTAQPVEGHVAALPPIVGARAASWFEGMVWLGEHSSALLLAPNHLTSTAPANAINVDAAFTHAPAAQRTAPEPVAVVFSTSVLPPSSAGRYALSGQHIAAIVQPGPAIPVPGCHGFIAGVTWWHRAIVPVIDFRPASDRAAHPRQLIAKCRQHGSLVAFAIDADVTMCRAAAEHRLLADVPCPGFASGVFDVDGEAVALLDLDALLATPSES